MLARLSLAIARCTVITGCLLVALFLANVPVAGQVPGSDRPAEPTTPIGSDSLFIFEPVGPLIDSAGLSVAATSALGANFSISASGYGAGLFFERSVGPTTSIFVDLVIAGMRTDDELPTFDNNPESVHYQTYSVPGKVNRLWQVPIMIGLKKELFRDVFFENFRPFAAVGLGGSLILATPYDRAFFDAFGGLTTTIAPGGFASIGAEFTGAHPGPGIAIRYYYILLDPPVFSLRDEPISQAGGLFLRLSVPF